MCVVARPFTYIICLFSGSRIIGGRGYSSIYSPLHTWHVLEHDILCHSILLLRMLVAVAGQEEVQW